MLLTAYKQTSIMKLDAGVVSKNSSSYIIDDLSLIEELSEEEQEIRGGYLTNAMCNLFCHKTIKL